MRLSTLLKNIEIKDILFGNKTAKKEELKQQIYSLTINSNTAKKNSLFVAINGKALNGESFIPSAIKNGATTIVCEKKVDVPYGVCLVIVQNTRKALAQLSATFYRNAHKKLKIIGITGTNGKSSCSYIIHSVLNRLSNENPNLKCGLIGTNAVIIGSEKFEPTLTTPDPIVLHEIFYRMVKQKVKICVMEISAHSIYFQKIFGLEFEVLALTNVKSDHLDFFKNQQNYINQKKRLFYEYVAKKIVLNTDDKIGKILYKNLVVNNVSIFFENNIKNKLVYKKLHINEMCSFKLLNQTINKTNFLVNFNKKQYLASTNLIGKINLKNLSLCLCVLSAFNLSTQTILNMFENVYVEGRLNIIKFNNKINFVLDYAHTYSSTKSVLKTVKHLNKAKNIIVVGAPGNRDEFKRRQTAKLCKKFGKVILTADNPKYENPYKIMEEMKKGINNDCYLIEDRKRAITFALKLAKKSNKNTNIFVLGKGIENYQDYNNKHLYYSDLGTINELLIKKDF